MQTYANVLAQTSSDLEYCSVHFARNLPCLDWTRKLKWDLPSKFSAAALLLQIAVIKVDIFPAREEEKGAPEKMESAN